MKKSDLWPVLRGYWHPVALSADVCDEKPLGVRVLDERLVLCRLAGNAKAFSDLCIHRGTPLSLGWVEGGNLVCAYHGWAYNGAGKCVRIPSIPPAHPIPKKACLTPYFVQEKYGLVWVCLSNEPLASIPEFPEFDDPEYCVYIVQCKLWRASAARVVENFLDLAHLAWIHDGILGDRTQPIPPKIHIHREGQVLRFWFDNIPDQTTPFVHRRSYRLDTPFTTHLRKEEDQGKAKVFHAVRTPHSAKETTEYLFMVRNYDLDTTDALHAPIIIKEKDVQAKAMNETIEELFRIHDLIFEQDHVIVQNQRPEELPLDLTEELHIKGPDAPALAYRRMLMEMGVDA